MLKSLKVSLQTIFPWLTRESLLALRARLVLRKVGNMDRPDENAPTFIAGLLGSHAGVASAARAQFTDMKKEGAEVYAIDLTHSMKQLKSIEFDSERDSHKTLPEKDAAGVVIIHQNPRWILIALHKLGTRFLRNKYLIGYWAWELETIPPWWISSFAYIHEVWVPSNFVKEAVEAYTDKPVVVMPYSCRIQKPSRRGFAEDGIIRVLFIFDFGSSYERKNPLAAIEAFKLAFGNTTKAELLIKVARPNMYPSGWEALRNAVAGCANIKLVDAFMSQDELDGLYCKSDIYLSLHRSEGFGLTIYEAMAFGLECVATGWSGNMDFFHGAKCHPVNYTLIPVCDPQNIYPYPHCRWAEPDVKHACMLLRQIAAKY